MVYICRLLFLLGSVLVLASCADVTGDPKAVTDVNYDPKAVTDVNYNYDEQYTAGSVTAGASTLLVASLLTAILAN